MIIEAPDENQKHYASIEKYAQMYAHKQCKMTIMQLLRRDIKDPEQVKQLALKITVRANHIYNSKKNNYKFFGVALAIIALAALCIGFFEDYYLIVFGPLIFGPYFLFKGFSNSTLPNLTN